MIHILKGNVSSYMRQTFRVRINKSTLAIKIANNKFIVRIIIREMADGVDSVGFFPSESQYTTQGLFKVPDTHRGHHHLTTIKLLINMQVE